MGQNKISGVYKITNNITGDFYIGSSKNIEKRWTDHKSPSRWKGHPGMKLYQAFIKYGLNNFTFDIIEETTDLHNREQYYIEQLNPSYNSNRAKGHDIERYKEVNRQSCKEWYKAHSKEWYKAHQNEMLAKSKAYYEAHRDEKLAKKKAYCSRLCFYENETLTLAALRNRFRRQGIPHATLEAKKYLIERSL